MRNGSPFFQSQSSYHFLRDHRAAARQGYEIERIVDHDFKFGTQWYKVAWKGWSEVYNSTWEPRSDLMKNAAKAVLKYEKENDISEEKPDRRKPKKRR